MPFPQNIRGHIFSKVSGSQRYLQRSENPINVSFSHKLAQFLSAGLNCSDHIWNLLSEFQFNTSNGLNSGLSCAVQTHILKVQVLPYKDVWWVCPSSLCMHTYLFYIVLAWYSLVQSTLNKCICYFKIRVIIFKAIFFFLMLESIFFFVDFSVCMTIFYFTVICGHVCVCACVRLASDFLKFFFLEKHKYVERNIPHLLVFC